MTEPNGVSLPQEKPHYPFNGLNSQNSSRGTSPVPRIGHIPQSQLPPVRGSIPASQLPPSRGPVATITQKVGQLSVSGQNTPNISPHKFSTSTPNPVGTQNAGFSENASPVVSSLENVPLAKDSADSGFKDRTENFLPVSISNQTPRQHSQFPVSQTQTSHYFSQSGLFNTHLNGPQVSQSNVSQSIPQFPPSHQLQPNQVPRSVPPENKGAAISQNHFPSGLPLNSGSLIPKSAPQSQLPSSFSQVQASLSQNQPSATHSQPNLISNQHFLTQKQGNVSQNQNNLLQYQPPTSIPQSQASFSSNQTNFRPQFPPYSLSNQPSIPPQIHAQEPTGVAQPPLSQNFSQAPIQTQYLQNFTQNPPQLTNAPQSLPPKPQYQTGLPPRVSPYPQTTSVPNLPHTSAHSGVPMLPGPLPSQRFNPQINYNVGPSVPGAPLSNQANFGPPLPPGSLNGPSSLPPTSQGQLKPGISANRYPVSQQQQQVPSYGGPQEQYPQSGVVHSGFSRMWGTENFDLLQLPNILPPTKLQVPQISLGQESLNQANCHTEVFRCTMTKIPETSSLLQKSRLPLGVLIHPFKDLSYLPVIQCNVIVRCRSCRTYINPFVYFVDSKRWKCNLCYRVNELPEEFQYDPVSKTYGDPSRRPEIKSSTIEYIAPAEYMLRPPQPAVYLFLMDVSRLAIESGYLETLCGVLIEELKNLPGDARTQIGFLAYDSALHFFSLGEGLSQPHEMTVLDIDDVFSPTPDNLLVNLKDRMEMVKDLLNLLPRRFSNTFESNSALGAALQIGHKMLGATGGRVTVFQASLPNVGPGALTSREDPNQRASEDVTHLNPANDFYKRLALECSGQQIAVDMFIVNSQYVDVATISGISRFSGGCIHHFPLYKSTRPLLVDGFQKSLRRYLTRKIGFEAVMRVRCSRGLSIHSFHGNFFVRSTDLLSLPNINPDAAFGMQVAIEENLTDCQTVCFQAALLYTSSKGERRIRVHTLCLPVVSTLHDVIHSADQQCVIGLLGKMAVDRSTQSSLSDAREAFINVAIDVLSSYKFSLNLGTSSSGLLAPECLKLLPLYISAILKHPAFRIGMSTRLDDRVKAMIDMKTKPLYLLMQQIYPDMYSIHNLENQEVVLNSEEESVPLPPRLQLTARCLENKGVFLMDCGDCMMILVGPNVSQDFVNDALGVPDYASIPDNMCEVPILDNMTNQRLHQFINHLNDEKPYVVTLQIIRDNCPNRVAFLEKLIEDRLENSLSYHEFLQHLKTQVK